MKNLSIALKQLRDKKGIGQKELALYLHCTVGTVSNYESGTHCPDLDTLSRIADFYGVSTDYLLGLNENATLDISSLNDKETMILYELIEYFKSQK